MTDSAAHRENPPDRSRDAGSAERPDRDAAEVEALLSAHRRAAVRELDPGHTSPEAFHPALEAVCARAPGVLRLDRAGSSYEGRPIFSVGAGGGAIRVLLWSQMHGDESTATRALADLFAHLAATAGEAATRSILSGVTMLALPMLNPDGAARRIRRNAMGIDVNRDALALRTPEGRLLRETAARFRPAVCFNLHDQELSTVGTGREITAMAFLAPAPDAARSENPSRTLARRVASVMADTAGLLAPGRVARYDDAFEPRAFGDLFQREGFGAVLVESGHGAGDPHKGQIRRTTFAALLRALERIADGSAAARPTAAYDGLPPNGRRAYDVIVRNVSVRSAEGSYRADLGISRQVDTHSEEPPRLVDAGDLGIFSALEELDGSGAEIRPEELVFDAPFDYRRLVPR